MARLIVGISVQRSDVVKSDARAVVVCAHKYPSFLPLCPVCGTLRSSAVQQATTDRWILEPSVEGVTWETLQRLVDRPDIEFHIGRLRLVPTSAGMFLGSVAVKYALPWSDLVKLKREVHVELNAIGLGREPTVVAL